MDEITRLKVMTIRIKEAYDTTFNYFRYNEELPLKECNEKAANAAQRKRDQLLIEYYNRNSLEKLNPFLVKSHERI